MNCRGRKGMLGLLQNFCDKLADKLVCKKIPDQVTLHKSFLTFSIRKERRAGWGKAAKDYFGVSFTKTP